MRKLPARVAVEAAAMGFSSLIGVIYEGILERVLSTIEVARANVSLALVRDSRRLDFHFHRGELLFEGDGVAADNLIEEADALYGGVYTLIRHDGRPVQHNAQTRWVLLSSRRRGNGEIEKWLHDRGYATGVVAHRQELPLIVKELRPEMILADCPQLDTELSCEDLRDHYSELAGRPVMVVTQAESRCRVQCRHMQVKVRADCCGDRLTRVYSPLQLCQIAPFNLDQLGQAMDGNVQLCLSRSA